MKKAVVVVSSERFELWIGGQLWMSYPNRVWEESREEGGVTLWRSRMRTREEVLKLSWTLRQMVSNREGVSGIDWKVMESSREVLPEDTP